MIGKNKVDDEEEKFQLLKKECEKDLRELIKFNNENKVVAQKRIVEMIEIDWPLGMNYFYKKIKGLGLSDPCDFTFIARLPPY